MGGGAGGGGVGGYGGLTWEGGGEVGRFRGVEVCVRV